MMFVIFHSEISVIEKMYMNKSFIGNFTVVKIKGSLQY